MFSSQVLIQAARALECPPLEVVVAGVPAVSKPGSVRYLATFGLIHRDFRGCDEAQKWWWNDMKWSVDYSWSIGMCGRMKWRKSFKILSNNFSMGHFSEATCIWLNEQWMVVNVSWRRERSVAKSSQKIILATHTHTQVLTGDPFQ